MAEAPAAPQVPAAPAAPQVPLAAQDPRGAQAPKPPVSVPVPAAPAPAVDDGSKVGKFFKYVLKDGGRNAKGEKCDADVVALVIGHKTKARYKLDASGRTVFADVTVNSIKAGGPVTVKQPVSETYATYIAVIWNQDWNESKTIRDIDASALLPISEVKS